MPPRHAAPRSGLKLFEMTPPFLFALCTLMTSPELELSAAFKAGVGVDREFKAGVGVMRKPCSLYCGF